MELYHLIPILLPYLDTILFHLLMRMLLYILKALYIVVPSLFLVRSESLRSTNFSRISLSVICLLGSSLAYHGYGSSSLLDTILVSFSFVLTQSTNLVLDCKF